MHLLGRNVCTEIDVHVKLQTLVKDKEQKVQGVVRTTDESLGGSLKVLLYSSTS